MKTFFAAVITFSFVSVSVAQDAAPTTSTFPKPAEVSRDTLAPHIGVVAGIATPEGGLRSAGDIGVDFGFQPWIPFGLGGELTYFRATGDRGAELSRTQALAKGTYNFGGEIFLVQYSYVGVAAGVAFDNDGTSLVSAPLIGFDIPVSDTVEDFVTLGASAKYTIVEGSAADTLAINGAVKYWF